MPIVLRLAIFYASMCLFMGIYLPYFPVWLTDKGFGPRDIALVLSGAMFLRIAVSPLLAFLADHWQDRRRLVLYLAWTAWAVVTLYIWADGFWPILLVSLLLMSLTPSIMPVAEAITVQAVKDNQIDYGRVRLWCSLAFMGASFAGGWLLTSRPPSVILVCMIAGIGVMVMGSHLLPTNVKPLRRKRVRGGQMAGAFQVARHPMFLLFLAASSLNQASHAVYYGFGTLNWQRLGYEESVIGLLWAVGVVAEIVLFAFSRPVIGRLGAVGLLILGAAGGVARWTLTAFSPPLATLFFVQILHALSFGATHLGAVLFVAQAAPSSLSTTAQSIYSAFAVGAMMGLAMLASGVLYAQSGASAYLVMAAMSAVSLGLALWLRARWDGAPLVEEFEESEAA